MREQYKDIPKLIKEVEEADENSHRVVMIVDEIAAIENMALYTKCEDDGDALVKLIMLSSCVDSDSEDYQLLDDVINYLSKKLSIDRSGFVGTYY